MSHPCRLLLRAPPHLPFVQGYPGIPASPSINRKAAGVHGQLELRVGSIPVKAKWVRVEIRKYESLPAGFPNAGTETWDHVGEILTVWKPSDSSKETQAIETSDFPFHLPLPLDIPPSAELPKSTGVRYELVAAICYKQKGGLFKKESYPILKISEPLIIVKNELHSAWPIYNQPSDPRAIEKGYSRIKKFSNDQLILTFHRPSLAFGPNDKIQFSASLKSTKSQAFKLKGFECTMYEVITSIPLSAESLGPKGGKKRKSLQTPVVRSRPISTIKAAVDERIGLGGEKSARIEMLVERALVSVTSAKSLKVEYELEVKAVMDGLRDKVEMGGIMYTVGVYGRGDAAQAIRDIGHVDTLCPSPPPAAPTPRPIDSTPFSGSQPDLPPNARPNQNHLNAPLPQQRPTSGAGSQPLNQGFEPRQGYHRQSSSTSDSTFTTTTTNYNTNEFGMTPQNSQHRPYATMPTSPGQRHANVMFPNPQPSQRPRSVTPTSPSMQSGEPEERYAQSDAGHDTGNNRYSTATMATFGRWDKGLRNAMGSGQGQDGQETMMSLNSSDNAMTPTTPTMPSPSTRQSSPGFMPSRPTSARPNVPPSAFHLSAEQEKSAQRERYENARLAQQPKKADPEIPEIPPPEYAPRVPAQPNRQYTAPSRPVSEYTSNNVSPANSSPKTLSSPRLASPPPGNRMGSSPPASVPETQEHTSAIEEKEAQRKRYEEAGVDASNSSGSKNANATASTKRQSSIIQALKTSPPLLPRSSLQQQQQQQGEASPIPYNAIFSHTRSSSVGLGISSASGSGSGGGNPLSEKEQMKRYYEAQDAVARAQSQSPPASPNKMLGVGSSSALAKKTGNTRPNSPILDDNGASGSGSGPGGSSSARPAQIATIQHDQSSISRPSSPSGSRPPVIDEKEQMRRYYEAQDKVAAASNRGEVSSHFGQELQQQQTPPRQPRQAGSAMDEKEQMRRYYEAQDNVARAHGTNSPNINQAGPSNPTARVSSAVSNANAGAVDEKEQMRRYYEAQDRVANASASASASGSGSAPTSQIVNGSSSGAIRTPPRASTTTAIDEKEQMRRYYEAQDRVARASASPPGPQALAQSRASSSRFAQDTPNTSPEVKHSIEGSGAVDEKEQMRRYYEAQDRVAQANNNPDASPSRSTNANSIRKDTGSGERSGATALDEKEQMRRYYEAQDRVSQSQAQGQAQGQASGSGSEIGSGSRLNSNNRGDPSSPAPILAPPVDSPPAIDSNEKNSSQGYMSAEQEKEMMRKRYEQATNAVDRYNSPSPSPSPPSSPSPGRGGTSSAIPAAAAGIRESNKPRTSLGLASEQMQQRSANTNDQSPGPKRSNTSSETAGYSTFSPPDSPLISRDPTIKAGKARAVDPSTNSTANANTQANPNDTGNAPPPPPLPARPPKEYVELLAHR
ncbi:uncharacterized protein I303_107047 [Kwoniella dejecticola CBS 10117]|uniref:Arrestin C-terminal-like domain-containing protein n=1 Tax=Kwoniella dejecticola CBS 10117 TaxID=1296121 RepID=A0A1A5ZYK3_9TREE|nr:uncharacterized protein I303_06448 [Kwoniella dejecticola CBS 10117]OBR82891.1 hypothetical protein I303_06448 [Kwoniella dejecticola CBS 10117]